MPNRFDQNQRLSRRERQIMEIIYQLGKASVADVIEEMDAPPSYSAIRTIMNLMVDKGFLKINTKGKKYIYAPALPRDKASRSALNNLLQTFFSGSVAQAVVSLINLHKDNLSAEDLDRLARLIEKAKTEESKPEEPKTEEANS